MSTTLIQQALIIAASLVVLVTANVAGRQGRLAFGFWAMWNGIGVLGIGSALLIPAVGRLSTLLGVVPAALLAAAASAILAAIALTLSLRVSALESALQRTAEHVATAGVSLPEDPARGRSHTVAVVPALNEAATVGSVVDELQRIGLPVIVVDDGSTDATAAVARARGATVIRLPTNLGVGGALRAGIRLALAHDYEQVVQCDADGQHPTESVSLLLAAQEEEPRDLLIGSRFTDPGSRQHEALVRRVAMVTLATLASRAARTRITDATAGLRIIRRPLLDELSERIPRHYLGDTFEVILAAGRAGYRIGEIPVVMVERRHGTSSASFSAALGLTLRAILVALLRGHPRLRAR